VRGFKCEAIFIHYSRVLATGGLESPSTYLFCRLISASFSAASRASAAFTLTSGATPVPHKSVFEMGLIGLVSGTAIMK
jgi:hypothetical protein